MNAFAELATEVGLQLTTIAALVTLSAWLGRRHIRKLELDVKAAQDREARLHGEIQALHDKRFEREKEVSALSAALTGKVTDAAQALATNSARAIEGLSAALTGRNHDRGST